MFAIFSFVCSYVCHMLTVDWLLAWLSCDYHVTIMWPSCGNHVTHLYYAQDSHSILEFMQRDLGITTVNAFRFVSLLPIAGIDQALVRGRNRDQLLWHLSSETRAVFLPSTSAGVLCHPMCHQSVCLHVRATDLVWSSSMLISALPGRYSVR